MQYNYFKTISAMVTSVFIVIVSVWITGHRQVSETRLSFSVDYSLFSAFVLVHLQLLSHFYCVIQWYILIKLISHKGSNQS